MTAQVSVGERTTFSVTDFFVRYGVVLVGLLVAIVFSLVIPGFFSANNAVSILQTQAVAAIAALGMTLTAVVGDLDLSVGAVAGLSVTVAAVVMVRFALTGGTAIVACLLAGLVVGCANAAMIVVLNVPPLLAALGTMFTVQGLKRWLVDGQTLITGMTLPNGQKVTGRFTDDFGAIDGNEVLGIPISVYLFALIAVLVWVFLERTRYGRVFYAV
ncbi:MAG: ABC transporter permease, partial [Pseudonocardia sp.]|nr:ABC transporter permease [Pseudonocardia sp.]